MIEINEKENLKYGIGFYMGNPIIIDDDIDTDIYNDMDKLKLLQTKLSNKIYSFKSKFVNVAIYYDGLIVVWQDKIDFKYENYYTELLKYAKVINYAFMLSNDKYINSGEDIYSLQILKNYVDNSNFLKLSSETDFESYDLNCTTSMNSFDFYNIKNNICKLSETIIKGQICPTKYFQKFLDIFDKTIQYILGSEPIIDEILLLTNSAESIYKQTFDISIILSFFVIERIIRLMWDDLLVEKQCKRRLKDERDYTISIISNILYFNGKIDKNTLNALDDVRRIRNGITHSNYSAFYSNKNAIQSEFEEIFECTHKVFALACKLFEKYYNFDVEISTGTII